ncbi:hypothetical protein CEXT_238901 [Caerostris extrusa]|uniref:Uncharacterized protein n=1 Tax=Caerostris extrusa TaxID=172846 RepID=A0AAV4RAZ8_CAEEX|nr:hypothetical protein CEXT_238901 [Caerostris extrusa]
MAIRVAENNYSGIQGQLRSIHFGMELLSVHKASTDFFAERPIVRLTGVCLFYKKEFSFFFFILKEKLSKYSPRISFSRILAVLLNDGWEKIRKKGLRKKKEKKRFRWNSSGIVHSE